MEKAKKGMIKREDEYVFIFYVVQGIVLILL